MCILCIGSDEVRSAIAKCLERAAFLNYNSISETTKFDRAPSNPISPIPYPILHLSPPPLLITFPQLLLLIISSLRTSFDSIRFDSIRSGPEASNANFSLRKNYLICILLYTVLQYTALLY